jgi:hypothetical protein
MGRCGRLGPGVKLIGSLQLFEASRLRLRSTENSLSFHRGLV